MEPRMGIALPDQASLTKIYDEVQKIEDDKNSSKRKEVLEFLGKRIQPAVAVPVAVPVASAPVVAPAPVVVA